MISQNELKSLLLYSPIDGIFTWIISSKRVKAGTKAGAISSNGRVYIGVKGKSYLAHRLAWLYMTGELPNGEIDHIDGNPLNNKFMNLRDVSSVTNKQNRRVAFSSTGILGVYKYKEGSKNLFKSSICLNRKQIHLGVFPTADAASDAYLDAKRKLHAGYIE